MTQVPLIPETSRQALESALAQWLADHPRQRDRRAGLLALESLRERHAAIWPFHLFQIAIPSRGWQMEAMLDSQLGAQVPAMGRQACLARLRHFALDCEFPLCIHDRLDAEGAPFPEARECGRLGAHALRACNLPALQAMHRAHPDYMARTWSGAPGAGALIAAAQHFQRPTVRSQAMLKWMTLQGADWDLPSIREMVKAETADKAARWEKSRRQLEAYRLAHCLPESDSTAPGPSRPRV